MVQILLGMVQNHMIILRALQEECLLKNKFILPELNLKKLVTIPFT